MNRDLRQLYLNLLSGLKVISYHKVPGTVYYSIYITSPESVEGKGLIIYLHE